jgi:hypothetical protein
MIVNGRIDALVRYCIGRVVFKGIVTVIGRGVIGKVGMPHLEQQARLVFFVGTTDAAAAAAAALVEPSMRRVTYIFHIYTRILGQSLKGPVIVVVLVVAMKRRVRIIVNDRRVELHRVLLCIRKLHHAHLT